MTQFWPKMTETDLKWSIYDLKQPNSDPNWPIYDQKWPNFKFRRWLNSQDVGVAAIEKIWEAQDLSLWRHMTSFLINYVIVLRNNSIFKCLNVNM